MMIPLSLVWTIGILSAVFSFSWIKQNNIPKDNKSLKSLVNYLSVNPIRDVTLEVPVYLTDLENFRFPDLSSAVQAQLDYRLENENLPISFTVINNKFIESDADYQHSTDIEQYNLYEIRMILSETESIFTDSFNNFAILYYTLESIAANDLPFFITQVIIDGLFNEEVKLYSTLSVNYFPSIDEILFAIDEQVIQLNVIDIGDVINVNIGFFHDYVLVMNQIFKNFIKFEVRFQKYDNFEGLKSVSGSNFTFVVANETEVGAPPEVSLLSSNTTFYRPTNEDGFETVFADLVASFYSYFDTSYNSTVSFYGTNGLVRISIIKSLFIIANNLVKTVDLIDMGQVNTPVYQKVLEILNLRRSAIDLARSTSKELNLLCHNEALNNVLKAKKLSSDLLESIQGIQKI